MDTVVEPTPDQLAKLSRFERLSFSAVHRFNRSPLTKAASSAFQRTLGMSWVCRSTDNLVHLVGFEDLAKLQLSRGLVLASNHRSFFDQYVISAWLFRRTNLLRNVYFPVRSEYIYDRPAGLVANFFIAAMAMYPPIFRDSHKRDFNHYSMKRLVQLLQTPGSVVGMHPEGTRNKGDDPYELLPAQPGIGKVILSAQPEVIPVFVNGLLNNYPRQLRDNLSNKGKAIIIVADKPLDLSAFYVQTNRLRTQKAVADYVLSEIAKLGEKERTLRQQLESY